LHPERIGLLQGEVAEAFDAWRKERGTVGEELADVARFLFSLAAMTGVDLQAEVEAKIEKNAARAYRRLPNGVLVKNAGPGEDAHR
jgi:NTP pyrophosphatase (non-canonical NTP hydrolase)